MEGAEDRGDERRLGIGVGHVPGVQFSAGGVRERHEHREMPGGRDVAAECAVGLPALDQRLQRREDGGVAIAELYVPVLLGVDRDERVVAPERAPAPPRDRLGVARPRRSPR
jgi:hypothetical protein